MLGKKGDFAVHDLMPKLSLSKGLNFYYSVKCSFFLILVKHTSNRSELILHVHKPIVLGTTSMTVPCEAH